MAYVAVKGGEQAIDNAHAWLAEQRRGDPAMPAINVAQIADQLGRAVDRAMGEGSIYDRGLAALAIKQAQGDLVEAAFLLRAYRTTLPRFAASVPVETDRMTVRRRISAIFKDLPGGQVLGPTYDYTHRLLDFALAADRPQPPPPPAVPSRRRPKRPRLPEVHSRSWRREGLIEGDAARSSPDITRAEPGDITREPLAFPPRATFGCRRWPAATRGSCWRWLFHAARLGRHAPVRGRDPRGRPWRSRSSRRSSASPSTSATSRSPSARWSTSSPARKPCRRSSPAATAGVRSQRAQGDGDGPGRPGDARGRARRGRDSRRRRTGQDIEFVLSHCDNIEATGFVEHLKLPHYVDFQSELESGAAHARRQRWRLSPRPVQRPPPPRMQRSPKDATVAADAEGRETLGEEFVR